MPDPIKTFDECIREHFAESDTGEVDYDFYGPDIHMVRIGYNTAKAHLDLRDARIQKLRVELADAKHDLEMLEDEARRCGPEGFDPIYCIHHMRAELRSLRALVTSLRTNTPT